MCKWKISLTQMFLHGMQGRLIRFCRPFMPGVEISHVVYSLPSLSNMPMALSKILQIFRHVRFMRRTVSMVYAPLKSTRPLKESN